MHYYYHYCNEYQVSTGGKTARDGADNPCPSSTELLNKLELYHCLPSVPAESCKWDELYLTTTALNFPLLLKQDSDR